MTDPDHPDHPDNAAGPAGPAGTVGSEPAGERRPSGLRNPAGSVRATGGVTLGLEAFVVLFALAPIAKTSGLTAPKLVALLVIVVLLIVAASTLGRGWGWWLGGVCQVLVIASGFLTPAMFILGIIFAVIWAAVLRFKRTIASAG